MVGGEFAIESFVDMAFFSSFFDYFSDDTVVVIISIFVRLLVFVLNCTPAQPIKPDQSDQHHSHNRQNNPSGADGRAGQSQPFKIESGRT